MKNKININNTVNSITSENLIDKYQKIKEKINLRPTINVKNNKNKRILLFSLYLLAFGATTVTTILVLTTTTTLNNFQFNPNANNKLWEDYYQQHHRDSTPINLNNTIKYFSQSNNNNSITANITTATTNNNVDFTNILKSIDNHLQTANIESNTDNDNNSPKLLPINFFLNVNNNPAVIFTIGKDKKPIKNDSFVIPKKFNEVTKEPYILNLTTNDQAKNFGIINTNINIQIHITIKNQIAVDISKLSNSFPKETINITLQNPRKTIDKIKNKLIPEIQSKFITILSTALNGVNKEDINSNYYQIKFDNANVEQDFNQKVAVTFLITADGNNPWKFYGKMNGTINVINTVPNLSDMQELVTKIEEQYNNDQNNKNFQITIDNKKDENNNYINADSKLSNDDLNFVNKQIISDIQVICKDYFQEKYPKLNIKNDDYQISTDLKEKDDIFNKKMGKSITITIDPKKNEKNNSYKLKGQLKSKVIVHGHNKNNITNTYSPESFELDGIYLKNENNPTHELQDGKHFYEQNKLLENWITNSNSLLNTIKNNSYQPVANSFNGSFTMNYVLDDKNKDKMSANIKTDITGGKATNFWDLLTKTKNILLETDVTTNQDRDLNNVKLIFIDDGKADNQGHPTKDNTLYTFDLSSNFPGISISKKAKLIFPNFDFNFSYQAIS